MIKQILALTVTLFGIILFISLKPIDRSENQVSQKTAFINNPSGFVIQRGVNISHWLSQIADWSRNDRYFNESDVINIKSLGFDHIRLPIDQEVIWNDNGTINETNFKDLSNCLQWCMKQNLSVIVDLQFIGSRKQTAESANYKKLVWTDSIAQKRFLTLWDTLSARIHSFPNNRVAYEVLNEAAAGSPELWNDFVKKAVNHIRKREPNRVLMIGSNNMQYPLMFPYLSVPEGDKNIILTFHYSQPFFITHYGANWSVIKDYKGPVHYPGQCITKEDYDKYVDTTNHELVAKIKQEKSFEVYNKEVFQKTFQPAIDKAKQLGLQLYCNEFCCLSFVDRTIRLNYFQDITDVFRHNNICWTSWDYKGQFGFVSVDPESHRTLEPDKELIGILVK